MVAPVCTVGRDEFLNNLVGGPDRAGRPAKRKGPENESIGIKTIVKLIGAREGESERQQDFVRDTKDGQSSCYTEVSDACGQ